MLCKFAVTFNPWKVLWNWIAFYRNSFVMSLGLMREETGGLSNEAYFTNLIGILIQWLSGSKTTNWCLILQSKVFVLFSWSMQRSSTFSRPCSSLFFLLSQHFLVLSGWNTTFTNHRGAFPITKLTFRPQVRMFFKDTFES